MNNDPDSYTIFVIPGQASTPYRFSIRKKTCKWLLGIALACFVGTSGIFFDYVGLLSRMPDLSRLRRESTTQKVQIRGVLNEIDDLQRQMAKLEELRLKVQSIMEVEATGTGDPLAPVQLSSSGAAAPPGVSGMGGPEAGLLSPFAGTGVTQLTAIEQFLRLLKTKADAQEKSFLHLTALAEARQLSLAATPSIWPTTVGWVSSCFGKRLSPFTGRPSMHQGIDISAPLRTPIIAPALGKVVAVGWDGGLGNAIKIDHGQGIVTQYGHLSQFAVSIGQGVTRGDVIGYVGNTGLSTGPHLHYEVIVHNVPTNPQKFLVAGRPSKTECAPFPTGKS
jgi:murein DD-endopeptidase MepM/ murein hydrolase activator NlpD